MSLVLWMQLGAATALGAEIGLYRRAEQVIDAHYLRIDDLSVARAFDEAAEAASDAIPWLQVQHAGDDLVLSHGTAGEFARVRLSETGRAARLDDLPMALARLEDAILGQGTPIGDDLDLPVELLRGAARALDRHSVVLAGGRLERFDERLTGKMSGIGATMGLNDGLLTVEAIFPDCPAERGGLHVGDRVVRIDGLSTRGITVSRAVERIRGAPGTEVVLAVERLRSDGTLDQLTLPFVRAEVIIPNVTWRRLPSGMGLITIDHFSEATQSLMRKALVELTTGANPVKGVVLDLRDNSGGSMIQSSLAADLLLDGGVVVRTTGRNGAPVSNLVRELEARDDGHEPVVPLVVLVDRQSASASEILAGSLAIHGRAALLGERTFGKGTVQKTYSLREAPDEVRLKLTVAEYRLDGDVRVADVGLQPDLWVDTARFDRLGAHLPGQDTPADALVVVEQGEGWGDGATARGDVLLEIAQRVLQDTRGHRRADVLASMERTGARVHAEEQARLAAVFAQGGIRWDPADPATLGRYPRGFPVEPPPVASTVRIQGLARAGSQVTLTATLNSGWDLPLHQARLRLRGTDDGSVWDDVVLPVGYVPPHGTASATAQVQLPPGLSAREDRVEVVLEADGLPILPLGESIFAIEARARPPLSASASLVAEEDHHRVELTLENRGATTLTGLSARFRFPEDDSVELLDREVLLAALGAGASARLDLRLKLSDTAAIVALPLDLVVEAEVYGDVLKAPILLPLDGARVEVTPPSVAVNLPLRTTAGALMADIEAQDDHGLDELTVWFDGEKIAWRALGGRKTRLELPLIVPSGTTALTVRARDDQGAESTQSWYVRGVVEDAAADR